MISRSSSLVCDVLVVGAGVLGLSVARYCIRHGLNTLVVDAAGVGKGASGGLLGALMPHMPTRWNAKKQFQFDALVVLSDIVADLESETGVDCGYSRCGRVIPIRTENMVRHARDRHHGASLHWNSPGGRFCFTVHEGKTVPGWLEAGPAALGYAHDTLAARLAPRQYLAALAASIRHHGGRIAATRVHRIEPSTVSVHCAGDPTRISAGHIVLAAGYQTFGLLEPMIGTGLGTGIKGQAALLRSGRVGHLPVIYDDGVYVVPHHNGLCAVGSTSEDAWESVDATDGAIHDIVQRAARFCPPLKTAEIIETWAGIRPKCQARDPVIGPIPGHDRIHVATGGFKITFGIAHKLAEAVSAGVTGQESPLEIPQTFRMKHHLAQARGQ